MQISGRSFRVLLSRMNLSLLLFGLLAATLPAHAAEPAAKVPAVPATFRHPGLLNDLEELHYVRKNIEAGKEPWKSAFETMKASKWANRKYKPHPHETVSSGFLGAGGAAGGAYDETDDAIAAYTQALMWIFTDDEQYAKNAVQILNAWIILKKHEGGNWYLMVAWEGSMFPLGAELIKATYPKWTKEEIARFSDMLNNAYLPILHNRMAYGNREFSVINALMAIGVFNDDRGAFYEGLCHWVSYVPCWIYLTEDGPAPIKPDYWLKSPSNEELAKLDAGLFPNPAAAWFNMGNNPAHLGDDSSGFKKMDMAQLWSRAPESAYVDGLCAETFRDLGHCDGGFAALINTAEIAWHQGIDLYSMHAKRITAFMELYSFLRMGDPLPKVFYRVQPAGMTATFEIAYNHYHNRMGIKLPKTELLIQQGIRSCLAKKPIVSAGWSYVDVDPGVRASQVCYPAVLSIAWETLTHANLNQERRTVTSRHDP
jgi:hypothetical protein